MQYFVGFPTWTFCGANSLVKKERYSLAWNSEKYSTTFEMILRDEIKVNTA